MNIIEFITQLESIRDQYGNVDVITLGTDDKYIFREPKLIIESEGWSDTFLVVAPPQ